jgi:hypothetical protein
VKTCNIYTLCSEFGKGWIDELINASGGEVERINVGSTTTISGSGGTFYSIVSLDMQHSTFSVLNAE